MIAANATSRTIVAYAELHSARASDCTVAYYRFSAAALCRWAGRTLALEECTDVLLSAWVRDRLATNKPSTVKTQRMAVMTLLRAAWREGLIPSPPRDVPVVWNATPPVRAYTPDEVRMLRDAAMLLHDWRGMFWAAAVPLAWDSGARRGDLLAWPRDLLAVSPSGGTIAWTQAKTGRSHIARIRPDTLAALRRLWANCPAELAGVLLPWPYRRDTFSRSFNRLKAAAGVTRGTFRWIRRGSGTSVEAQQRHSGHLHLGHADPAVFRRHYEDRTQLPINWPQPESL